MVVRTVVSDEFFFGVDEFNVKYGSWFKSSGKHWTRVIDHHISIGFSKQMQYFIGLIGSFQLCWTLHIIHPQNTMKWRKKKTCRVRGRGNSIQFEGNLICFGNLFNKQEKYWNWNARTCGHSSRHKVRVWPRSNFQFSMFHKWNCALEFEVSWKN